MNRKLDSADSWRPQYPETECTKIELEDMRFSTYAADRKIGLIVQDKILEDPAVFWIDHQHVYLRVNWSIWGTVSLEDPNQVVLLCRAPYCRINHYANNVVTVRTAPVFHISELPKELFGDGNDGKSTGDDNNLLAISDELLTSFHDNGKGAKNTEEESNDSERIYNECFQLVNDAAKSISKDLDVFRCVTLDDCAASFVIANEKQALVLDILPKDRDFVFTPADGKEMHRVMNAWPTDQVSLDFIEKLEHVKACIAKKEPESMLDIGILTNTATSHVLEKMLSRKSELLLLTYDTLVSDLKVIFN